MNEKCKSLLDEVRKLRPLVHHITNYVTVNDCANATLAIGGSPVMADCKDEAAEIAGISNALVLNMGTLNSSTVASMFIAGREANAKGVPVVFDPVGAGASKLRDLTALHIIREIRLSVVRGNISEIKSVSGLHASTKGVDASEADMADASASAKLAKDLAERLGAVVVVSGAIDTVSDGKNTLHIENGHKCLGSLCGTGCMCSSLIGTFLGAAPSEPFAASVAAMASMGVCGEIAGYCDKMKGIGSFRTLLLDAISRLDGSILERAAKIREAD